MPTANIWDGEIAFAESPVDAGATVRSAEEGVYVTEPEGAAGTCVAGLPTPGASVVGCMKVGSGLGIAVEGVKLGSGLRNVVKGAELGVKPGATVCTE